MKSQIPRPLGRGIRPSRHSPTIRASAAAWLIARGNKFRKDVIKMVLFINKNVNFYKTSVSNANKIYGPVQGSWFDPTRP